MKKIALGLGFLLKAIKLFVLYFVFLPALLIAISQATSYLLAYLNLGSDTVLISGTGSMYPTFPKGSGTTYSELVEEIVSTPKMMRYPRGATLWEHDFLRYTLQRGDIVAFSNSITDTITQELTGRTSSYVKRIIALAGDTVEIRDGILYLNNEPQLEPYIARARSTFGGDFIPECQIHTVPENSVLVFGDNRTASNDSRHKVGFVQIADIHNVIPWDTQPEQFNHLWRDPSNDLEESSVISLDIEEYVALLNQERTANNVQPLTLSPRLSEAARLRGQKILAFNDFSPEATISGYPMRRALQDAGYANITYGESFVQGYYEAQELLEQQIAFPDSKDFILTAEYQDIGVAVVRGEINGCPTQVIVRHFGGYIPPNYPSSTIASWRNSLQRLTEIKPSWENATDLGEFYDTNKDDIDRVIAIINLRIQNQQQILEHMENNRWLPAHLQEYAQRTDIELGEEQARLSNKVNER